MPGLGTGYRDVAEELTALVLHTRNHFKDHFLSGFEVHSTSSSSATDSTYRRAVECWDELQQLVEPEVSRLQMAWGPAKSSPAVATVIAAMHRSLSTQTAGGEPQNLEARRQLLFFSNSLFNKTLSKPPPITQMKSW